MVNLRLQDLKDTAKRRVAEAWLLLHAMPAYRYLETEADPWASRPSKPHRWWADGAVTCALLAAECALKATLLHGHAATDVASLSDALRKLFGGKTGHNLTLLWEYQHDRVKTQASPGSRAAIFGLGELDRYHHRYGQQRPEPRDAGLHVDRSVTIVAWMNQVLAP